MTTNNTAAPNNNPAPRKGLSPRVKNMLILGGIVLFFVAIIGMLLYYLFFYSPVNTKALAKKFCECSQNTEVQASMPVLSNDDFRYKIGLESCIGAEFAKAGKWLNDDEKHYYLGLIQDEVFKSCPLQLSNVFVPIPRPPRPNRDSIAPAPINIQ